MKFIKIMLMLIGIMGVGLILAHSQVPAQFTQYQEILPLYNPSFSGIENHTDFRFGLRRQWVGINQSPFSTYAHVSSVLPKIHKKKRRSNNYKSPYNISQMADSVRLPNNSLRMSNPHLYRKMILDSIRLTVRKLDRKARIKIKRQMQPKSSLKYQSKHGYSTTLVGDQQGAITNFSLNLGYAYHIPLSRTLMLSAGLAGSLVSSQFDSNKAQVLDVTNDPLYQKYASGELNKNTFYINSGLTLYSSNFYLSYSIIKILAKGLSDSHPFSENGIETQHNIAGSVFIRTGNDFLISPGALFIYKNQSPFNLYATAKLYYKEKTWIGLNYKNKDSFGGSLGLIFMDQYKFSYAYDISTSKLSSTFGSTHEIVFGIMLNKGSAPKPIIY